MSLKCILTYCARVSTLGKVLSILPEIWTWSVKSTFHWILFTPFWPWAYFDLWIKICFKIFESYCIKISQVIINTVAGISYHFLSTVIIISEKGNHWTGIFWMNWVWEAKGYCLGMNWKMGAVAHVFVALTFAREITSGWENVRMNS